MPSGPVSLLMMLGLVRVLHTDADAPVQRVSTPTETRSRATTEPVVTSLQEAMRGATKIEKLERPRWIRHRIRPRERITQIAARYGVGVDELVEWNRLDPDQERPPRRRRSLRVRTDKKVPGRFRVWYRPQPEEGWGDIAARFRVEQPDLRAWNWRVRHPRSDRPVQVWVDPGIPYTIRPNAGPPVPERFAVPPGGLSVGHPHRGRLVGGVQLPESPMYTRGFPGRLYGSSHTVEVLLRAFAIFRHDTGYEGEVVIGAMSRRAGRRFPPHISHQSGRDVDIRLPLLPGIEPHPNPNPDEIDWYATWGLVRAFVDTAGVAVIFLDAHLQRRLYEAARVMGETHESLREVITWPSWRNKEDPLVRHFRGHDGHIHVRFRCAGRALEPRCR